MRPDFRELYVVGAGGSYISIHREGWGTPFPQRWASGGQPCFLVGQGWASEGNQNFTTVQGAARRERRGLKMLPDAAGCHVSCPKACRVWWQGVPSAAGSLSAQGNAQRCTWLGMHMLARQQDQHCIKSAAQRSHLPTYLPSYYGTPTDLAARAAAALLRRPCASTQLTRNQPPACCLRPQLPTSTSLAFLMHLLEPCATHASAGRPVIHMYGSLCWRFPHLAATAAPSLPLRAAAADTG